jgi:thioredoxin reductase
LLRLGRDELAPYETVELRSTVVSGAERETDGFSVTLEDGSAEQARMLLLATGVMDAVPEVAGIEPLFGRSVFHCPYCDGWEQRGKALAVYGKTGGAVELALKLTTWSRDIVVCTDGRARLPANADRRLSAHGIGIHRGKIERLESVDEGQLSRIVFRDGSALARDAMFLSTGQRQQCDLPRVLGCRFNRTGAVRTGRYEVTHVPGLYVAGDASRDLQLAITAAAEGAQAAFAINTALTEMDLKRSVRAD